MSSRPAHKKFPEGTLLAADYMMRTAIKAAREDAQKFAEAVARSVTKNGTLTPHLVSDLQAYLPSSVWRTATVSLVERVHPIEYTKSQYGNPVSPWIVVAQPRMWSFDSGEYVLIFRMHRNRRQYAIDILPQHAELH